MRRVYTDNDTWILCPNPRLNAKLRLFCFPYAGGGASIFRNWSQFFSEAVEICSIQLPGRENRLVEFPYKQLLPLCLQLANVIKSYNNIPFVFFGHSLGGLISFELTRQLRRQNISLPTHIIISGSPAPNQFRKSNCLHCLPDSQLISQLQTLQGTPEAVLQNPELI